MLLLTVQKHATAGSSLRKYARKCRYCFGLLLLVMALLAFSMPARSVHAQGWPDGYLSMMVSGPTSYIGFVVTISGEVRGANGTGLSNTTVYVWYKFQDNVGYNPWSTVAVTHTNGSGSFSIQWIPTATGDYVIEGNLCNLPDYPGVQCGSCCRVLVPVFVSLDVLPTGNQQLLSVASNSTIVGLAFNSTSQTLAFQLNGTKGTTAWIGVSIAQSLLPNANLLQVKANSANVPFQATLSGQQWLVTFTVRFESIVNVSLNIPGSNSPGLGILSAYLISGLIFIVGLAIGLKWQWLHLRLRKLARRLPKPNETQGARQPL